MHCGERGFAPAHRILVHREDVMEVIRLRFPRYSEDDVAKVGVDIFVVALRALLDLLHG